MISKVIILTYQPITNKIKKDFFLEKFVREHITVEFWVLSRIFHKSIPIDETSDEGVVFNINDWNSLKNKIAQQNQKKTIYFLFITYEGKVIRLFRLLTIYKCRTAFFGRGMLAFPAIGKPLFSRLVAKFGIFFKLKTCRLYLYNLLAFVAKKIDYVKPYDIIFSAGELGYITVGIGNSIDFNAAKIISINSPDYDYYQEIENDQNLLIEHNDYCVFLDEYLPYHPDYKILGLTTVNAIPYYESLNRFFDLIERKHKLTVIIASHPKAVYEINPYNDRPVYQYRTAELVKNALLVLAHFSTSVSYAVLFKKPLLFLYNDEIEKTFGVIRVNLIKHVACVLGSSVLNIDQEYENLNETINYSEVDLSKYAQYRYKYLTSLKSEDEITEDIIISTIKEI